jgi:hypothetical protein
MPIESIFFARDLEFQEAQVYQQEYPAFRFREIFPVSSEGGEAVQQIAYRTFDRSGLAKVLSDYATDWPTVNLNARKDYVPVKRVGDSAKYSRDEVLAAQAAGMQLDSLLTSDMRRAYEEKLDRIAAFGDASGLLGWNTNPYIPIVAPTTSSGSGDDTWPNKTPDEILADITLMQQTIIANTQGSRGVANMRLMLSPSRAAYLRTARISNTTGTLISFVRDAFPNLEIVEWQRMATATPAGGQRASMMEASPDVVQFLEPAPFRLEPLEKLPGGLVYQYLGSGKTGGLVVRQPLAAVHLDGI